MPDDIKDAKLAAIEARAAVLKRMGMVCHYCGSTSTRLWESPDGRANRVCTSCYNARWGNPFPD